MATRFGLTWWGRRWIGSLEALGAAYANRLPRGRTYARRGAVHRLDIQAGRVTARVDGRRPLPYRVGLSLPVFSDEQWDAVIAALAGQVRHAAALLDGRMPDDIDDTVAGAGVSLFPRAGELTTTCSCPDHANPCKHVAAVHYVLAQTFDGDPFLLPTLRGRRRDELLTALRAARTGAGAAVAGAPQAADEGVAVADLVASRLFDPGGDLAAVGVQLRRPDGDATVALERLGPPPVPGDPGLALDLLCDAARTAAGRAWRLAVGATDVEGGRGGDGNGGDGNGDPGAATVLAELRSRGSATTRELADALAREPEGVRASLRALVGAGVVDRTGHARGTRYQAW
ncbi:MAG: SWIM zinc finger family protein [Acidimicrobiales bacterium]